MNAQSGADSLELPP